MLTNLIFVASIISSFINFPIVWKTRHWTILSIFIHFTSVRFISIDLSPKHTNQIHLLFIFYNFPTQNIKFAVPLNKLTNEWKKKRKNLIKIVCLQKQCRGMDSFSFTLTSWLKGNFICYCAFRKKNSWKS